MNSLKKILPDNPAARLLSILSDAIKIQYSKEEKAGEVWAKVLKVKNTPSEFLPSYGQLFVLVNEAYEKVVQFYPKQQSTHAGWRNKINKCLQNNSPYHHQWSAVNQQLKAVGIIDMLQIAADNLGHFVNPTAVDDLSLKSLREEFEALRKSISNDNTFSEHLKRFLIEELENILNCLIHYDLYGSVPIKDSIYNIVSNIELHKTKKTSLVKKLGTFLFFAASAISIVNNVAVAPENLTKLRDEIFVPLINAIENHSPSGDHDLPQESIARKETDIVLGSEE